MPTDHISYPSTGYLKEVLFSIRTMKVVRRYPPCDTRLPKIIVRQPIYVSSTRDRVEVQILSTGTTDRSTIIYRRLTYYNTLSVYHPRLTQSFQRLLAAYFSTTSTHDSQ
jgi:hypothetical protein